MASTTADARPARRRRWGLWAFLLLLLAPAALFALWTFATLTYTYSRGDRVGYNQKFSRKGWICKTWEGELAISNVPGQAPQLFQYSVRDDAVAQQIQRLEGQRVAITYEQHNGVPTNCFGETPYFVVAARPAGEAAFPAPLPGAAVPPAAGVPQAAPTQVAPAPAPAPAPAQAPAAPAPAARP
jgi:hypothetical protein